MLRIREGGLPVARERPLRRTHSWIAAGIIAAAIIAIELLWLSETSVRNSRAYVTPIFRFVVLILA